MVLKSSKHHSREEGFHLDTNSTGNLRVQGGSSKSFVSPSHVLGFDTTRHFFLFHLSPAHLEVAFQVREIHARPSQLFARLWKVSLSPILQVDRPHTICPSHLRVTNTPGTWVVFGLRVFPTISVVRTSVFRQFFKSTTHKILFLSVALSSSETCATIAS
jgi:hypothetical protein